MSTWLYFATVSLANEADTLDLARTGFIWRTVCNRDGAAIANVKNVHPGDNIALVYQGTIIGLFQVIEPGTSQVPSFPAAAFFPEDISSYLQEIRYVPDPHHGKFTGFFVEAGGTEDLESLLGTSPIQIGRNALQRYDCNASQLDATSNAAKRGGGPSSMRWNALPFMERPPELHQPTPGSLFLGVDVGYARKRESLGYCILQMGPEGIQPLMNLGNIRGFGTKTIEEFEKTTLPELLRAVQNEPFLGIALDGPMVPDSLNHPDHYRSQERLLLQTSALPVRIRAQAYKSGIGKNLTEATLRLRRVCECAGYSYAPFSGIAPGGKRLILEAFPKIFLGPLFDPAHIDDNLNRFGTERFAADWAMATWVFDEVDDGVAGDVSPMVDTLEQSGLPISTQALGMQAIFSNKDITAAYVSALSSVLAFAGAGAALGSDRFGSFLLPASWLWHPGWKERFRNTRVLPNLEFMDNI